MGLSFREPRGREDVMGQGVWREISKAKRTSLDKLIEISKGATASPYADNSLYSSIRSPLRI